MENTNEQVTASSTELFLGLDKTQLGVVLVTAKTAQEMSQIIQSDVMDSAFQKLRGEYKDKPVEEQLAYIRSLKTLCQSSIASGLFAMNLVDQIDRHLTDALLAQRNVASVSE